MMKKSSISVIENIMIEKETEKIEKIEKFVSFQMSKNSILEFTSDDFLPMSKDTLKLLKMKPNKSILKE